MTTEAEERMTHEQWAAIEFEPWTHMPDEWKPPTNEKWADDKRLPTVRLAWHLLYKTKAELVAGAVRLGDEDGVDLMEGFADARKLFETFAEVLAVAEARLFAAAAVAEMTA